MADNADRAGDLIEIRMAEALARREQPRRSSLRYCINCDEEIPEKRRALGGVTRCVECQEIHKSKA